MNSQTGCKPARAAPTANPAKPCSVILHMSGYDSEVHGGGNIDDIRSINDPLVTESVQQALGDLVRTVVLGNLLSQDEDLRIALQLLRYQPPQASAP